MQKNALIKYILVVFLITMSSAQAAYAASPMPAILKNSYLGLSVGYGYMGYTNKYVEPGFKAGRFKNNQTAVNFLIGHYFNQYLSTQINLMRPVMWVHTYNENNNYIGEVWTSVFSATLQPTLPITKRDRLFLTTGYVYRSRHGINHNNQIIVADSSGSSFLIGGGYHHIFGKHFLTGLMANYTLATKKIASSFYVGAVGAYYFDPSDAGSEVNADAPENYFTNQEVGGTVYSRDVVNFEWPKKIYLFWNGGVKLQKGFSLNYKKLAYHSDKWFSLEWGLNFASMVSVQNKQNVYAFSIFPSFKFWLFRTKNTATYFSYTIAGPSYISKSQVDNNDTGKNFTFYDAINLGTVIKQKFDIGLQMAHYSNGNVFTHNPGFCIPLSLHLGYAF